jgi:hypothetical protein
MLCAIKVDGEVIHNIRRIDELNEFYRVFGYTDEMTKNGIVADEFVWDEYIRSDPNQFSDCVQMHLIEYLNKYSPTFISKYGDVCKGWMTEHANARKEKRELCIACKIETGCKKDKL